MAQQQTAVTQQQNHNVALASTFEQDAGGGFETADADAYAIPFLAILQSGSPQVKKSDGAYIKGAEEGFLFNTVTQALVDGAKGVDVIPCYYKRSFIRWAPRDAGGGFKGEYAPSDVAAGTVPGLQNINGEYFMDVPAGVAPRDAKGVALYDQLSDTRTHYVLVLDDVGGYSPAVISFGSTQIKKSRQWMSKMNGIKMTRADKTLYTPPMFSHVYHLSTVPESNDKGSWFGWKIETKAPLAEMPLYGAAKSLRDSVVSGAVREQQPAAPVSGYEPGMDVEF